VTTTDRSLHAATKHPRQVIEVKVYASESAFASYKKELIHTRPWPDLKTLAAATADWVDNYFNIVRRHSYLGYLTPREYELRYTEITQLAA
jgi:putative transposase